MSPHIRTIWRHLPLWSFPLLWTLTLGSWGLYRQDSLWRDEAATWQVALRSTADIWHMLGQVDAVHGLYYLAMHGLFECFGPNVLTLRLPSVVAMGVAAACVSSIARGLAGFWAGLGSGFALGLLPAVQFYLQEGRSYAIVAAIAGVATLLLVQIAGGRAGPAIWVSYSTLLLVGAHLNWLLLLILPAHLVTLVWTGANRTVWIRWILASGVSSVGSLPLILFSRTQSAQVSWIPPLTWHMLIAPTVMLVIGGIGALLDCSQPGRVSLAAIGLPLLAVPQLLLVGISLVQPLFLDRYILFSLLGLALLIGSILAATVRWAKPRFPAGATWIVPVVLSIAMVAMLPQFAKKRSPESRVDDVLAVASEIQQMKRPGDAVVYVPAARRDTALVSPKALSGLRDVALEQSPSESGTLKGIEASPRKIEEAMLAHRRIMLVTDASDVRRPLSANRDRVKADVLKNHFAVVADEEVRGRRLIIYAKRH